MTLTAETVGQSRKLRITCDSCGWWVEAWAGQNTLSVGMAALDAADHKCESQ